MFFQIELIDNGTSTGTFVTDNSGPRIFATGVAASRFVNRLKIDSTYAPNINFKIIKVLLNDNNPADESWKKRERDRLGDGTYTPVPWAGETWFLNSEYVDSHFPHISVNNPGMVAFTMNHDKGVSDFQQRVRAGRYLKRFFGSKLSEDVIRDWASQVSLATGDFELLFAHTSDDIVDVYKQGPRSCMSYVDFEHTGGHHPCEVYGAGDLAVAYIKTNSGISCRAICWPDKKIYGRVYGDGGNYSNKFRNILEDFGYEYVEDFGAFDGARIFRVQLENNTYLCPYLDIAEYISDHDDEKYMVIGGGIHLARSEYGVTDPGCTCESCDARYDPEESGGNIVGYGNMCGSCMEIHSFVCNDCGDFHHIRGINILSNLSGGRPLHELQVCNVCIIHWPECGNCGKNHNYETSSTSANSGNICPVCMDSSFFHCNTCSENYLNVETGNSDMDICIRCNDASGKVDKLGSPYIENENQYEFVVDL